MKPPVLKRAVVLIVQDIVCSVLALWFLSWASVADLLLPRDWLWAHLGPIIFIMVYAGGPLTVWVVTLAVTNLLCISAYLVRPNVLTGIISFLGIAAWLFLGVIGMSWGV